MNLIMKITTRTVVTGGVIAALYAVLTYVSAAFGLAYGPIQLRVSEVLTLLPLFTPVAVPGLTVGCFLANIGSSNAVDLIFGTAATLIAALLTRLLQNVTIKSFPALSFLSPVIVNAVMVGFEISAFFLDGFTVAGFALSAVQVGCGELLVIFILGTPFYCWMKKHKKLFD